MITWLQKECSLGACGALKPSIYCSDVPKRGMTHYRSSVISAGISPRRIHMPDFGGKMSGTAVLRVHRWLNRGQTAASRSSGAHVR